jgi:hypothetical protein
MSFDLKNLFLHPDTFFAENSFEKKNFLIPAIFVAIGGGYVLWGSGISIADLVLFAHGYTPLAVVEVLVLPFILWILVTMVIYIIARACSGTGSLRATLQNTGFGMFPLAISVAVNMLYTLMSQGRHFDPVSTILYSYTMLALMIWCWYLWYVSSHHTHRISRVKAGICIIGVIVLQFALLVFSAMIHSGEM